MDQLGEKEKTKSLRIGESVHTELKVYCAKNKTNMTEVVEMLILTLLAVSPKDAKHILKGTING